MIGRCGGVLRRGPLSGIRCCLVNSVIGSRKWRGLCASSSGKIDKAMEPAVPEGMTRAEAYRKIHDLDFTTAAKILFTAAPDKKKFGLDFHLVQLFFACLPSLAVYLVAQYARYEIRRMEAEVELKKQAEEEERAKRAEEEERDKQAEEEAVDREMEKVKGRLDALEEAVKGITGKAKANSEGSTAAEGDGGGVAVKTGEAPPPIKSSTQYIVDAQK